MGDSLLAEFTIFVLVVVEAIARPSLMEFRRVMYAYVILRLMRLLARSRLRIFTSHIHSGVKLLTYLLPLAWTACRRSFAKSRACLLRALEEVLNPDARTV